MRKLFSLALSFVMLAAVSVASLPSHTRASSHREAPAISMDPTADNTDVYAFVSPDQPDTVTLIANYIPFQEPTGGPYFYNFDDNVKYAINVDLNGNGKADVVYEFQFRTQIRNPETFLYNTGPINDLDDADWNYRQVYSVSQVNWKGKGSTLGKDLPVAPANIGPRSTPDYDALSDAAVHELSDGVKVFAGPRDEPFYIDTGSIFDLLGLRPFNPAHVIPLDAAEGVDGLAGYNVHTIAIQVPIAQLLGNDDDPEDPDLAARRKTAPIIGVYASAMRQRERVLRNDGTSKTSGPWIQVSRLGNPLINEVIIPVGRKDYWNAQSPSADSQFQKYYEAPEPTKLANLLYPVLDNAAETGRGDLVAILLNGVKLPDGSPFTFTGNKAADLLRLNTAIPPTADPSRLGVLEGDLAGFPNGRRPGDDVVDIELRALAEGYGSVLNGLLGLPNRTPNNALGDGVDENEKPFLDSFPYLALPHQGYEKLPPAQITFSGVRYLAD